jgi:hypothetical protein
LFYRNFKPLTAILAHKLKKAQNITMTDYYKPKTHHPINLIIPKRPYDQTVPEAIVIIARFLFFLLSATKQLERKYKRKKD